MKKFYVYLHLRKTDGKVFYVGKGQGRRKYSYNDRSDWWKRVVEKHGYTIEIAQDKMMEPESFLLEMWLIAKFRHEGQPLVNLTDGGDGPTGKEVSEETKEKLRKYNVGEKSCRYDSTIYEFKNKDGRSFTGTRYQLRTQYDVNENGITNLIAGRRKTTYGWYLNGVDISSKHMRGDSHYAIDKTIRTFIHKDGYIFSGTQYEFYKSNGLRQSCVNGMVRGKRKSVKGWRIVE